jgi:phasin family protein
MLTNQEYFPFAAKAFFESQLASVDALAHKALLAGEKFSALNIATAKASTTEFVDAAQQLLATKDARALLTFAIAQAQANADRATSYGRHLRHLISTIQTDCRQAADAHIGAPHSKVTGLAEGVTNNLPPASINAVAMLKSVIRDANASHEQLRIGIKPPLEQITFDAVKYTDQLSQPVETAPDKTE